MEETIRKMIKQAETEKNISLIGYTKELLDEFAVTINCPSNWRDLGTELAEEYNSGSWVYEKLGLWDYVDESEENHLSAENGDYSPSCPWNAPGMSVKDFI